MPQNAPWGDIKDAGANTTSWPKTITPRWSTRPQAAALSTCAYAGSHQQSIGTMAVRTFRYWVRFLLPLWARRIRVGKQVRNHNIMNVERKEKPCSDKMVGNVYTVNISDFHIQLIYFPLSVLSSTFKNTRVLQRLMWGDWDGRITLKLKGRSNFQWLSLHKTFAAAV